jgi:hypothetical protein
MKQFNLFLFLSIIFIAPCQAQDSIHVHHTYHAKITLLSAEEVKGYLTGISDSALFISSLPRALHSMAMSDNYTEKFDYRNIGELRIQPKGTMGKSILIGAVTGLVAGLIIGAVSYTPPQNEAEYLFNPPKAAVIAAAGLAFTGIGIGVGALIGSHHDKYLINGEWKNLQEIKQEYQNK